MHPPNGLFTRVKRFLAGVDAEILARCPLRDHDNVSTIAWMLIGVWVWQTGVFALVAHLMLAQPGEIRPELIGAAMLLASLILLLDSYMVIRSSWYLSGLEELKRAGLRLPGLWSARIKNGAFLAIRILIAVLLAVLNGIFTGSLIFRKDIDREIARAQQAYNAPVVAAAQARVDGDLQRDAEARDRDRAWITAADEAVARLRRTTVEPVTDPELQAALERVPRLEAAKTAAADELTKAQAFAADELAGRRMSGDNSGVPGTGPVRRAAEERRQAAEGRTRAASRELAEAQKRLEALRTAERAETARRATAATEQIQVIQAERGTRVTALADRETAYQQHMAQRDDAIRMAVERDPAYAPREDGYLARVKALVRLSADPWIGGMVLLFDAAFFLIELAAVLAKVASFVPSTYATILAREELGRAHLTSRALAADINGTPPAPPPPDEPEPPLAAEAEPSPDPDDDTRGDGAGEAVMAPRAGVGEDPFRTAARLARARAERSENGPPRPANGVGGSNPGSEPIDGPDAPVAEIRRGPGRPPGSKNRPPQPLSDPGESAV